MGDLSEILRRTAAADADRIGLRLAEISLELGRLGTSARLLGDQLDEAAADAGQANIASPRHTQVLCREEEGVVRDIAGMAATAQRRIEGKASYLLGVPADDLEAYVRGLQWTAELDAGITADPVHAPQADSPRVNP